MRTDPFRCESSVSGRSQEVKGVKAKEERAGEEMMAGLMGRNAKKFLEYRSNTYDPLLGLDDQFAGTDYFSQGGLVHSFR